MEYRVYFLDSSSHSTGVRPFECDCDDLAIPFAEQSADKQPFELWNRDRLVVRRWVTELTE
jgi:hypothetical protein